MGYVIIDNKKLEYSLKRTAKKNVNISVKSDGAVYVSAPKKAPISEIERIIISKSEWIFKAKSKLKSKIDLTDNIDFDSKKSIYYFGNLKAFICIPADKNYLKIENDKIILFIKERYFENEAYKNKVLKTLLTDELKRAVTPMLYKYLKATSRELSDFKIRDMKSRWGTCIPVKKEIILNYKLVFCPLDSVEYVVLHEVAHLTHANHSKSFYNLIAKNMPTWNDSRKKLRDFVIS